MNYYPFHIGDYASATRHLSWDEDAAYRRLLDVYYTTEHPLPRDLRACCRLVLATLDAHREAVRLVLGEFFVATDEGWVNTRADAEIREMKRRQQVQRDKANRRWAMPRTELGNAPAMPQHTETDAAASKNDANAMPPTPTPTPTPKEKKTTSSLRASRLPPDWSPGDSGLAFAKSVGFANGRAELELAKFRDYWTAKGGSQATKTDWQATWRNWLRTAAEKTGRAPVADDPFAGAIHG